MINFNHHGSTIYNPFLSPDLSCPADPINDYGFETVETGGGAKALSLKLPCGSAIFLTDSSGLFIPSRGDTAIIGLYDKDGACVDEHDLPEPSDIQALPAQ